MERNKSKIIVILGPTASGKTALSLSLAQYINFQSRQSRNSTKGAFESCITGTEIVSADSCQIYRGMDIGTAKAVLSQKSKAKSQKPDLKPEEYYSEGVRHHLVNIKNPDEDYSVSQFKKDATTIINDLVGREVLPIVVGGTAQYIYALVDNWRIPEVEEDPKLRTEIETMISEQGLDFVFQKLLALDPEAAYVVDPKNPRRVVRALEVAMLTGKPFTEQRGKGEPLFESLLIGINPVRVHARAQRGPEDLGRADSNGVNPEPEILKTRITERVKNMLVAGLVEEVKKLFSQYGKVKALDAIGYRETIAYLNNEITLAEAEQQIISNTIHFAKHQMTWFKRDQRINWIKDSEETKQLVENFLP